MFHLPSNRPALMGILNVTPDSFSDGGLFLNASDAVARARAMMEEGADLIDVGGESTRPGAEAVELEEEWRRIGGVLGRLAQLGIPVSVDTRKPEIAKRALEAGASVINDVGGFRDPKMLEVACSSRCSVCVMHMQGEPATMQLEPKYADVVAEVLGFLEAQAAELVRCGKAREQVWIDPGIGFGKKLEHNRSLLQALPRFAQTGYPVLLGVSRKSFVGTVLGSATDPLQVSERLEGTLAVQAWAQLSGVRILRVHDVRPAKRVLNMISWLSGAR
ncbi:MAG: dihydropteroate synthase [Fimbriimonadales bacterium]|nr:dihydropteroate synthase [Fimbriimonadales bacterium]